MKKIILSLLLFGLLSGCVNLQKQSFNSGANKNLQQIVLINPPPNPEVGVVILYHAGRTFGLIGEIAAAADMQAKTKKYNQAIGPFNWDGYVHQQLANALMQEGYAVKTANFRPIKPNNAKYLKKYPEVATDALLDYYYSVGQVASGVTTSYVPTITLHARLVDPRRKTVLYEEHFNSGLPLDKKMTYLPMNQEYKNINDLLANSEQSKEALKLGIQQIAARLASDLKK